MKTAWFLFSVDNNYDQPPNNLEAWWEEKPSLEILAYVLNIPFPGNSDEETISIVNIWAGKCVEIKNTEYRLESHVPGKIK